LLKSPCKSLKSYTLSVGTVPALGRATRMDIGFVHFELLKELAKEEEEY